MALLLILSLLSVIPLKASSEMNQPVSNFIDWQEIEEPADDALSKIISSAADTSCFNDYSAEESFKISTFSLNSDIDFDYFEESFNETVTSQQIELCLFPNVDETTYKGDSTKITVLPISTNAEYSLTISAAIREFICMQYIFQGDKLQDDFFRGGGRV